MTCVCVVCVCVCVCVCVTGSETLVWHMLEVLMGHLMPSEAMLTACRCVGHTGAHTYTHTRPIETHTTNATRANTACSSPLCSQLGTSAHACLSISRISISRISKKYTHSRTRLMHSC